MDCRITLNNNESFHHMLEEAFAAGEKIYMLIDENGLQQVEGVITSIETTNGNFVINLDNGRQIPLKTIAALNGVFLPEYGEC